MKTLFCFLIAIALALAATPSHAQISAQTWVNSVQGYQCPNGVKTLTPTAISAAFTGAGNIKILTGRTQTFTKAYRVILYNPGPTAMTFGFTEGTGTNCATANTVLSNVFVNVASTANVDLNFTTSGPMVLNTAADDLCLNQGTALTQTVTGMILACQD